MYLLDVLHKERLHMERVQNMFNFDTPRHEASWAGTVGSHCRRQVQMIIDVLRWVVVMLPILFSTSDRGRSRTVRVTSAMVGGTTSIDCSVQPLLRPELMREGKDPANLHLGGLSCLMFSCRCQADGDEKGDPPFTGLPQEFWTAGYVGWRIQVTWWSVQSVVVCKPCFRIVGGVTGGR